MTAERAWIQQIVSDDVARTPEEQITQLFEALRDSIYRYVFTITRQAGEAEEITQEAFLRLVRELHLGRSVNNPKAWVFRVAHNAALDETRTRKFRQSLDDAEWLALQDTRSDPAPDPEAAAVKAQEVHRWRVGLLSLPEQQRACLLLRVEGFRYREIAEILGVSTSTVAESLRRAIRRMMKGADA